MLKADKLIRWWLSPKFPAAQFANIRKYQPQNVKDKLRNYLRTYVVHPIKRRIAKYYLLVLKKIFRLQVIGITGSVGKTTAKEMLAKVLKQNGQTIYSFANIDPIYNIPTTILKCRPSTRYLILEMGVEYPGEMDFYLWLAKPDIGIITAVYWSHSEFLGNLNNILLEKGKLIRALPQTGVAILNADDQSLKALEKKTSAKVIRFSVKNSAEVRAKNISLTSNLKTQFTLGFENKNIGIKLNLLGTHFVSLALAAASAGMECGLTLGQIKKGLEFLKPIQHRMVPLRKKKGIIVIDDTYNASPLAVVEAIKVLNQIGKDRIKILVLGDMKELGSYEKPGHREVAVAAVNNQIDRIYTLGYLAKYTAGQAIKLGLNPKNVFSTNDKQILLKKINSQLQPQSVILIKGSRAMALDRIVADIAD